MKKIALFMALAIAVLLALRNPHVKTFVGESPKELWQTIQVHIAGITEYEPEKFAEQLTEYGAVLTKKEQRYVRNISKSASDLLIFVNRSCSEKESTHIVLSDGNLLLVCKSAKQVLLID